VNFYVPFVSLTGRFIPQKRVWSEKGYVASLPGLLGEKSTCSPMNNLLLVLAAFAFSAFAAAQTTLSAASRCEGEPLVGANVYVKDNL
jgi:hypothetical protein